MVLELTPLKHFLALIALDADPSHAVNLQVRLDRLLQILQITPENVRIARCTLHPHAPVASFKVLGTVVQSEVLVTV